MGFSDRLRAWLKGESKQRRRSPQTSAASRTATTELEEFVRSRIGVEAYLEPRTTLYSTTVLLIADDGEYLRRPVTDRDQAASLCGRLNIPLYDARKVGYPRRMREYDQGRPPQRVELSELPPWPDDDAGAADVDGPPPPPVEPIAEGPDPAVPPDAGTEPGTGAGPDAEGPQTDDDEPR